MTPPSTQQPSEPSTDSEFVTRLMECYMTASGRISTSPVDYQHACDLEATGMPFSVAQAALQEAFSRPMPPHKAARIGLAYVARIASERYEDWKRAVGPMR